LCQLRSEIRVPLSQEEASILNYVYIFKIDLRTLSCTVTGENRMALCWRKRPIAARPTLL